MRSPEINQTSVVVLRFENENRADRSFKCFELSDIINYFLSYHRVACSEYIQIKDL